MSAEHQRVRRLAGVWVYENTLWLKVVNTEVRGQNVLGKLLLKLFLDFLAEHQVDLGVFGVEFGQNYQFETTDNSGLSKFKFLLNLEYFFIIEHDLIKVARVYSLLADSLPFEQLFNA